MKFSYKFSNLLGAVYRKGNIEFLPDGLKVVSPVGNRVSVFDLKNSKSETLPIEGHLNFTAVAISPDGCLAILVNEEGEALLCSLISRSVIGTYHFHNKVNHVSFSPDGKKFVVTRDTVVLMFHAPGKSRVFNPFLLNRTFYGAFDETTCVDWSSDSKVIVVGSKDMNTRVFAVTPCENLVVHSMGGHTDAVVGAFFEHNSMTVYSASKRGHLCVWECNQNTGDLVPKKSKEEKRMEREEDEEDEERRAVEDDHEPDEESGVVRVRYKKLKRHVFKGAKGTDSVAPELKSCAFHKPSHILVSGFANGTFMIHEMPDFNLIHSLTIAEEGGPQRSITSVAVNSVGDLIALGCAELGQLLVWEWQSQQQVLKQQAHFNQTACLAYSPNGQNLASGGDDGKVKVWDTASGFSYVTFDQHTGKVTDVTFIQNGKAIVSSSLDGTVRAFDLTRYRNFRTFVAPQHVQFSCVAVDPTGEVVCAGCQDVFEIFVWSMKTNRLLEVLADHTGPVSCLAFSKGTEKTILASGSWDCSVKLWEVFESRGAKETLLQKSEVLALDFHPNGKELAVSTLSAQIHVWDAIGARQTGTIEGRHDLGYGRTEDSKVTGKTLSAGRAFTTLTYSGDGKVILAGGNSPNVVVYSIKHQLLMKKFPITVNHSFDGVEEYLQKRQNAATDSQGTKLSLPGVRDGNFSARRFKPEIKVLSVKFSPTGREWAAATTEGLLIYSLDQRVIFDPYDLEIDITPSRVRSELQSGDYAGSLILALRLNEEKVIQEVVESTPFEFVESICQDMAERYVDRLLSHLSQVVGETAHLHFYVHWVSRLLVSHGPALKARAPSLLPTWAGLEKSLARRRKELAQVVDHNIYTLQYLCSQASLKVKDRKRKREAVDDSDSEDGHLDKVMALGEESSEGEEEEEEGEGGKRRSKKVVVMGEEDDDDEEKGSGSESADNDDDDDDDDDDSEGDDINNALALGEDSSDEEITKLY
ncbi:periodic tryptophan protein 2 homolog [Babylonia areolata]|uniref:periodic tryptophan protein 2 homolog n=1 Tax=Babylonia areolata TaxID=304850 RepID=UPI003FD3E359